ncbi:glycosyl transferase [Candidatus Roizmanbacteria bacterium RIFCSPLOWO2_01_FULL_41_22]|uniref:Glycosyl transferase n=1 Tax=Candidatus Roizmanbacteria bacterium RIFCSPLOWO2_01_FULL_41_22 TaxID=1802067 RepID=A0A1F7J6R6_9BACT|nr:MAG: glycosyl transferase [Candidatus Roizmanbacteria bacterium RIFCSPLOWO2_01_FULL_41_22]
MKYSVILPVYNEEENLSTLYDRVSDALKKLKCDYELIFVNDGSRDHTPELLNKLHSKDKSVKIINFSRNFGHQTAVTAGLQHCSGDYIAIMDADLQDPPEILAQFFAKLDDDYDVVYAIRTKRKESYLKRMGYDTFYRFLHFIANIDIPLDSGDFCVMNKKVVAALNSLPERNRFVRGLRSWVGFRQIGIEYERASRHAGESKYPISKLFKLAFDGIFSFSYVPLQMMFVVGFIAINMSILATIWVIYQRFFTENYAQVPGFATTVILVTFIGGVQLFSLGVVGEYMKRMFDEIKQRPQYIIDSTSGF